ncbi:MAG: 4-hydroxy-3-methylbut-2-enyl diphosphate reductase [Methylococcaceae bacterium]|nr:4-hydroxy-3-methylbut-2-enyl diphosphate reductase [Methylococcaceae bacterium]MCI0732513.1 4-hydroxy-3-methylbut-2-enyl diphosphate reductase [Methylococcaceae bacterium]
MTQPRGFCAGVVRAIEIVESALQIYGAPVYVVHEIVHNQRVVEDLRSRGAVFVETLDEVPADAVTVFSAHGVSEQMIRNAENRGLEVINATCPLVTKVHLEVVRNAKAGNEVVLIGHAGHPEVNGTLGHFDRRFGGEIYLVQDEKDVEALHVKNPARLTYVTQTTLSVDDTKVIVAALRKRFPEIIEPRRDDICYATQNRQSAVRKLADRVDLLIVVGARNSSNSNRLREVGEQMGVNSFLVEDANDLDLSWFTSDLRIGITAGASTPEILVQEVLRKLDELGVDKVVEMDAEPEKVTFRLPAGLVNKLARKA